MSPLAALRKAVNTSYAQGCDVSCSNSDGFPAAADAAAKADVSVVFVGIDQSVESEGHDRTSLSLPGARMRAESRRQAI